MGFPLQVLFGGIWAITLNRLRCHIVPRDIPQFMKWPVTVLQFRCDHRMCDSMPAPRTVCVARYLAVFALLMLDVQKESLFRNLNEKGFYLTLIQH